MSESDQNNLTVFDRIRSQAKRVAENASHIQINYDQIDDYVKALPIQKIKNPPLDPAVHYVGHEEDTVAYFLTLETINFGSGYFPHLDKNGQPSGYFTVAAALNNYYVQNGPFSAFDLSQLKAQDCVVLFKQSMKNIPIRELMDHFTLALNQLGHHLLEKFNGSFIAFLESANHSAEQLVNLLSQIPCFYDVADYDGLEVPLFKRAQITAADTSLAFSNKGLGYFKDLDQLTIFADNMIPHVLRCDGILVYEDSLASLIDQRQLIVAGSKEEIELRACAIHTVELIKEKFHELGHDYSAMDLDYLLWNRGQAAFYQIAYPIHLTRSTFY